MTFFKLTGRLLEDEAILSPSDSHSGMLSWPSWRGLRLFPFERAHKPEEPFLRTPRPILREGFSVLSKCKELFGGQQSLLFLLMLGFPSLDLLEIIHGAGMKGDSELGKGIFNGPVPRRLV